MCPYARFQSAMFDKDTLIVSYDAERGEPRGARKKTVNKEEAGLGDCINCAMCVQVCPVGIDIRNGLQYQCIGCAACIDACDEIMDKMGYPSGLIRYTTESALEHEYAEKTLKTAAQTARGRLRRGVGSGCRRLPGRFVHAQNGRSRYSERPWRNGARKRQRLAGKRI